jgi:hypothetical protein
MVGELESLVENVRFEAAARQVCLRTAGRTIEAMVGVRQLFDVVFESQIEVSRCRRSIPEATPSVEVTLDAAYSGDGDWLSILELRQISMNVKSIYPALQDPPQFHPPHPPPTHNCHGVSAGGS